MHIVFAQWFFIKWQRLWSCHFLSTWLLICLSEKKYKVRQSDRRNSNFTETLLFRIHSIHDPDSGILPFYSCTEYKLCYKNWTWELYVNSNLLYPDFVHNFYVLILFSKKNTKILLLLIQTSWCFFAALEWSSLLCNQVLLSKRRKIIVVSF